MVTRILFDKVTKTAVGVEYVTKRKTRRVYVRKEVIVSGGAINSPQLLMLSGIGPGEHLNGLRIPVIKDAPVGENLMDHVAPGSVNVIVNETVSLKSTRIAGDPRQIYEFTAKHSGQLTVPGGAEALALVDLDRPGFGGDGHPNVELLLISGQYSDLDVTHTLFGFKPDVYDKVYKVTERMDGFLVFPMIMRPKSKGRLRLKDANPFSHPLIDPNYFADETDLDVAVAGVRIFFSLFPPPPPNL